MFCLPSNGWPCGARRFVLIKKQTSLGLGGAASLSGAPPCSPPPWYASMSP